MATVRRRKLLRATEGVGPEANVMATVFSVKRADSNVSRQIALSDEFLSLASAAGAVIVLPTPYNVGRLFELVGQSNMIQQCVEAYVTNTVTYGWELESTIRGKEIDPGEAMELQSFIDNANTSQSLTEVMEDIIRDRESCGFGFMETIRDAAGRIALVRHAKALYTRLCAIDPQEILVEQTIMRGRRITTVREYRKFRRFIQIVNGRMVWFKEFGDPRRMDFTNGAFEGQDSFSAKNLATEIIHFKRPSTESYGIPQWVNQLPNIIGSREAEEVNMRYFEENTVPPMLLMIGGGRLTSASYQELTRALNQDGLGKSRQHKIMLLEAVGEGDSLDGKNSSIDLKVEKLSDARQSDGLFKAYDEGNMAKVRSSFRLPPITVGMSQDVNFATASTSAFVAESQVFAPERQRNDAKLNRFLVNGQDGLKLTTVRLVGRTPLISSPEMTVKTLTALNTMGAVTPRSAQTVANKMLQLELKPYPEKGEEGYEKWMDEPILLATKGQSTHDAQNQKTDAQKQTEATGIVEQTPPKNGEQ